MANFSNISKPGENFYTAFTDFFFFSFVNHRNSQVGPTVCCEIEKQCSLQLQYSTTPSHVVRLSLVQSVLTTAMHLKVLQKKKNTLSPQFWEQSQNKHAQRSLGDCVWRRMGGGVTEGAVCWSPFSKLSLFNISLKQTPRSPNSKVGWPMDLGGSYVTRIQCSIHDSHGAIATSRPALYVEGWWSQGHPAP